MDYVFINVLDNFKKLNLDDEINQSNHYISLIIIHKDKYGHIHAMRNRDKSIYKYQPNDIYNNDFKFKKDIKNILDTQFRIKNIKKISHICNIVTNHIYIVWVNKPCYDIIKREPSCTDNLIWHMHFILSNNKDDILFKIPEKTFYIKDFLTK